jgi:hypothetical protein
LVRFGAKAVERQALAVHVTLPRAGSRNFLISLSVLTSGAPICTKGTPHNGRSAGYRFDLHTSQKQAVHAAKGVVAFDNTLTLLAHLPT